MNNDQHRSAFFRGEERIYVPHQPRDGFNWTKGGERPHLELGLNRESKTKDAVDNQREPTIQIANIVYVGEEKALLPTRGGLATGTRNPRESTKADCITAQLMKRILRFRTKTNTHNEWTESKAVNEFTRQGGIEADLNRNMTRLLNLAREFLDEAGPLENEDAARVLLSAVVIDHIFLLLPDQLLNIFEAWCSSVIKKEWS